MQCKKKILAQKLTFKFGSFIKKIRQRKYIMHVLCKIKSKKFKLNGQEANKEFKTQQKKEDAIEKNIEQSNRFEEQKQQLSIYETQKNEKYNNQKKGTVYKKQARISMIPQPAQYITNTNILTKQKQLAIRQKQFEFLTNKSANSHKKQKNNSTINSKINFNINSNAINNSSASSNGFSNFYKTNKQTRNKKTGIYFEDNASLRHKNKNSFLPTAITTNQSNPKIHENQMRQSNHMLQNSIQSHNHDASQLFSENEDEQFTLNFDFLLSNREKKEVKKSLHMTKGKVQNIKEIQSDLFDQNQQVICLYIKKLHIYGDICVFEGEIQSLKRRYLDLQIEERVRRVYDKVRIKVSCPKDLIIAPQSIGRIYIKDIVFLSESQGMIMHEFLLKTVEKSRRMRKG